MDKSLKDRVLETIDIVEVIGERVALTRQGKDFIGLCPFHPDHKPSMSVSPRKQIFKCWSCGAGGDVIRFVQMFDRVEFREALAHLARRAGLEVTSSPADREAAQVREELQQIVTWAREHFRRNLHATPAGQNALDYAHRRGLTDETIERHALGHAPDSWNDLLDAANRARLRPRLLELAGLSAHNERKAYDRFRNRLIFPIADALGRAVAFGGRTLGDDPAKYLNSPETPLFSKSRILYAFDLARKPIEEANAAIVVEGYMDAVLLHQFGFRNVVATLGTAMTGAHAKLLRPRAATLYLCFDGDEAGFKAADRGVEVALQTQTDVRVVLLPGGQDPADCVLADGAEGFAGHLKGAVDALEFKWSQTLKAFGAGGQQAKRIALEKYLHFVAGATLAGGLDPLQQNLLIGRLSDLLGVPAGSVFELLAGAKRTLAREPSRAVAEQEGASDYEGSLRALPAGLVTACETVFGLLLTCPRAWRGIDDTIVRAVAYSQTWQQLYSVFLDVHADVGEYSVGEVMARCEDSALCELVSRASARVTGVTAAEEELSVVQQRLADELALLQMSDLRERLPKAGPDTAGEDLFAALRAAARKHESPVPAECRWNAATPAPSAR
jgi:DNA primase